MRDKKPSVVEKQIKKIEVLVEELKQKLTAMTP